MSHWNSLADLNSLNHYLIIIGIVIGSIWGILVFIVQARISKLDDIKNKEFEVKINLSEEKAKQFEQEAESLKFKQKEVTGELSLNKEKLEKQKKELESLEKKTLQRSIPKEKIEELKKELIRYSGEKISIRSNISDPENQNLSFQLWSLFESAGWVVKPNRTMYNSQPPIGIHIIFNNETFKEKAQLIFKLLKQANLKPDNEEFSPNYHLTMEIIVGSKD